MYTVEMVNVKHEEDPSEPSHRRHRLPLLPPGLTLQLATYVTLGS